MSYDVSKRIFIGNLPEDITKKEIADFIRRRTRANPSNLEIATTKFRDGSDICLGYAHCSVEGMKSVIQTINGLPLRDGFNLRVESANPHFSVKLKRARQEKEKAEEERKKALEAEAEAAKTSEQTLDAKRVRPWNRGKVYYAKVAAELSLKGKEKAKENGAAKQLDWSTPAHGNAHQADQGDGGAWGQQQHQHQQQAADFGGSAAAGQQQWAPQQPHHQQQQPQQWGAEQRHDGSGGGDGYQRHPKTFRTENPAGRTPPHGGRFDNNAGPPKFARRGPPMQQRAPAAPPAPPPPPPPPPVSKDKKKLENLKAKLEALKGKLSS